MTLTIIVGCSLALQIAAAVLSVRLIRVTGGHLSWGLIAVGMFFMTLRRVVSLADSVGGGPTIVPDPLNEYLGLTVSLFLFFGVVKIAPLLGSMKRTERALLEKEQELSSIIQTSPQAILATDIDWKVVLWNREAERIFGWREEEVLGQPIRIVPPEVRGEAESVRRRVLAGETVRYDEAIRRRKDGTDVSVAFSAGPLRGADGNVTGLLAILGDMTDRRRIEDTLRQSEDRYSRVLAASSMGISLSHLDDGVIIDANDAFISFTGYTRDEVIGRTSQDLGIWADPGDRQMMVELITSGAKRRQMEVHVRKKSGDPGIVLLSAELIQVEGRQCILSITHDITEEKRAGEELVKLRKAVEASGEVVFMTDRQGVFTFVNPAFTELYGYPGEEVIGTSTPRILKGGGVSPEDYETFWKKIVRKERVELELVNRTRAGRKIIVESAVNPVLNEKREIIGFLAIQKDVTDKKVMEGELEQARAFAENVIQTANVIFLQLDPDGNIVKLNPAGEEITGYSFAEVRGKNWFDNFVPRERFPFVWAEFERFRKTGEINEIFENPVLTKGGEERQTLWKNTVLRENGLIVGTISFGVDITDRKRAEEARRESAEMFRQLTENIREVFWLSSVGKNEMIFVSPAYESIWGRTVDALYESPGAWLDAIHPDDRARVMDAATTRQVFGTYDEEYRIVRPEGEIRWIRDRAFPVRNSDSVVYRIAGVAEDVTERKQSEEIRTNLESQLQQSQRLEGLGTLASGIAHDFNNILAIILGQATALRNLRSDPEKFGRSLGSLEQASLRGASLVRQLLTLARKTESVLGPVLIGESIAEITKLIGETFPRNLVISSDVEEDLPAILADATQIHQVLLNLCVNARDAMPEGGSLSIEAKSVSRPANARVHPEVPPGEFVAIRVADSGSGMDDETKRRIFEPFFTTKGPGKGTGLGLALVYSIVRNHHGFVDVESAPGKGTAFRVYLPVPARRVEVEQPVALFDEAVPGGNETVLLIEDEEMLSGLVTSVLEEKGYTVIAAYDGEEGVAMFRSHVDEIDIVVTDVGLPKFGGEEVFRRIRAIDPAARVILVSGFIDPDAKASLHSAGAAGFLQKPYVPAELLKSLRATLDATP